MMGGNPRDLARQMQQMQTRLAKIQEELGSETVEASVGGGMVTIVMTGHQVVESVKIEKDAGGEPTGVIMEWDYQPLAELTWFRQAGGFTREHRALGLPIATKAYHACGTTSVFEEHGVANELLRAYKDA